MDAMIIVPTDVLLKPPLENALPTLMNNVPADAPPQFVAMSMPEFW